MYNTARTYPKERITINMNDVHKLGIILADPDGWVHHTIVRFRWVIG